MTAYFGYDIDFIDVSIPIWDFDYGIDGQLKRIRESTEYLLYRHDNLVDITQDVVDLIQMYVNLFVKIAPDFADDDYMGNVLARSINKGDVPKCDGVQV